MKNIKHILDRLREVYQVPNNRQLSTKIEVNYNTMATWIKRDIVPYEKLHDLVQKENISFDWLLNGVGEKYLNSKISTSTHIKSTEDNRDSEDFILFYDEYERMENYQHIKLILNKPKKIYRDNPLLKTLSHKQISKNQIILFIDDKLKIYTQNDSITFITKLINENIKLNKQDFKGIILKEDNLKVKFNCIIKNNLFDFDMNYPLYDNKYLGVEWNVTITNDDNDSYKFVTSEYINGVSHSSEIFIGSEYIFCNNPLTFSHIDMMY